MVMYRGRRRWKFVRKKKRENTMLLLAMVSSDEEAYIDRCTKLLTRAVSWEG